MRERWGDPDYRERTSKALRGQVRSAATRAKIAAAKAGVEHSPETKRRMAAKHREMWADPAYREMMKAANAKQGEALRARWADPEFRARMMAKRHREEG